MSAAADGASPAVPDGSEPGGGPIFVVGSMRSGSTMLRLILDSHPNIAIGSETGFVGGMRAAKEIPGWRYGKDWYERVNWTEPEFDARLRDFYGGIFARYAAEQGKPRWGEKTPFHTSYMGDMARVFPDAVFVGIVRHPGAVATSLRKKFHYTFAEALSYWISTNLALVRAGANLGGAFVLCRYEDLVVDAEPVLRQLTTFLGEPWSDDLLQHHRVQREKGAPRVVDGSTVTRDPIDSRRALQWVKDATDDDLAALDTAAELGRFFGYEPREAEQRGSLSGHAGSHLVTGEELRRRMPAWSDRVDFDQRPPTIVIDASPEELAERLTRVEQALERARSRRAVRLADAMRKVQHGRSLADLRAAWAVFAGSGRGPEA